MKLFLIKRLRKEVQLRYKIKKDNLYLKEAEEEMQDVFCRVEKLMKEKRLYLNGDLCLNDVSKLVYRDRTYVSKTINKMSSKNFRTYVNGYRVQYAVDLMKRDSRMRFKEVANMSGFNSLPTFNSSFKEVMRMCPSQYMRNQRLSFLQSLPRQQLQEL